MKLARVVYTLYKADGRKEFEYTLDTDDLSIEEFAQLKVLLERSGILDTKTMGHEKRPQSEHLTIRVTTADGSHTACLDRDVLSDEMSELVEFLKSIVPSEQPAKPYAGTDVFISPHQPINPGASAR